MKRFLVALAIGGAVFGGTAYAASLGGVQSNSFGAGTSVVASCDTDGINVYLAANNWREDGIYVTGLSLTNVAATCNGHQIAFFLSSANGTYVGSGGGSVNPSAQTTSGQFLEVINPSGTNGTKGELIDRVSVVIY